MTHINRLNKGRKLKELIRSKRRSLLPVIISLLALIEKQLRILHPRIEWVTWPSSSWGWPQSPGAVLSITSSSCYPMQHAVSFFSINLVMSTVLNTWAWFLSSDLWKMTPKFLLSVTGLSLLHQGYFLSPVGNELSGYKAQWRKEWKLLNSVTRFILLWDLSWES